MIKRILKIIGSGLLILLGIVVVYLAFMTVTDYRPEKVINLEVENNL